MKRDSTTTETLRNVLVKLKRFKPNELSIWDVDDTLFATDPKFLKIKVFHREKPGVQVKKNGKPLTITTHEFADPKKLKKILDGVDGALVEPGSFADFRSAKIFRKHAKAIEDNLKVAQKEYNRPKVFFLGLTARSNMIDDVEDLLQHFDDHKLNIRKEVPHAHLVRARSITTTPGAEAKADIIRNILEEVPSIKIAQFWDDSSANIEAFMKLANEFPTIKFVPHPVKKLST